MMSESAYSLDIVLRLQSANRFKSEGLYHEARQELEAIIVSEPRCAPAYNNLGTIYFHLKEYTLAIQSYQAALDIRPDYIDVYYNLGLAYLRMSRDEEALTAYLALIALVPTHPGAHFQLGCLMMKRQRFLEASQSFNLIAESHQSHFESLANLAVCHLHLGRLDQAVKCYLRALDIIPSDHDILFNLGVIHIQQGYAAEGVKYYLRAVKVNPDFFDAHHNLGTIYLMRRDHENALLHLREALRIQPEAEALRHTIKILMQDDQLTGSAPQYIQSLFDSYADYYDVHLRAHLQYQVPEKLYALLNDSGVLPAQELRIVDIGCGTGFCGELLRPHASHLVGVDLSPNMLSAAAEKEIYDELIVVDAVQYLADQASALDLIVAGDVLVYFGELEALMLAASQALAARGYFAFNVELTSKSDYALTSSGRFAHHQEYLEQLAKTYGFTVIAMRPEILRRQQDEPVPGYLCLWQLQGSGAA